MDYIDNLGASTNNRRLDTCEIIDSYPRFKERLEIIFNNIDKKKNVERVLEHLR